MKKLIAITAAVLMLLCAIPALAFTGYNSDPGMPLVQIGPSYFPAELIRCENEPNVIEPEHPWEDPVTEWVPMEVDGPIKEGDTVTAACRIQVPETIEGFLPEQLESIEVKFSFEDLDDMEIVYAEGGTPNFECDFEIGICFPLPGYGNIRLEEGSVIIDAALGSTVTVVVQGTARASKINCSYTAIIGQYKVPAHFSVGKLTREDGYYFISYKDVTNVQMRGMKFYVNDEHFDHFTVFFNNHDYIREDDDGTVIYYEVGHEDDFFLDGELFDALELAYHTNMDFFGFTDDGVNDVMTDGVFLKGGTCMTCSEHFELGSDLLPGDADGNGQIDTTDALLVLRAALKINDNADELLANCDMDNNGKIDTTDALIVLRRALHIL